MTGCHLHLSEAAAAVQGRLVGADGAFTGVGSDSRHLAAGQLFVALEGPHFDGHDYVAAAAAKGAAAVMVAHEVHTELPQVVVGDTWLALGELAAFWRDRFTIPVIAVTGSNGKTTVKEMLAAILARRGAVLATRGNLNNEIGVPLTLLRLNEDHRASVIEEGASHAGDIAYLTRFVRPTVAVVTNAGGAHLAGFGSLEVVARTKGEIYQGLAPGGTAVINADDAYAPLWRELAAGARVLTFGSQPAADVHGLWRPGEPLHLHTPKGEVTVMLRLAGRHNACNALAATAAALAVGADLTAVKDGLEAMRPIAGRLEWKAGLQGSRILDDSYNANPDSLAVALEVLAACPGRHYLLLGDMAELGEEAMAQHVRAGRLARAQGVARLFAVGELTRHAAEAFGEGGRHFVTPAQAIESLRGELAADTTLLVKGSRAAHLERVVAVLSTEEAA